MTASHVLRRHDGDTTCTTCGLANPTGPCTTDTATLHLSCEAGYRALAASAHVSIDIMEAHYHNAYAYTDGTVDTCDSCWTNIPAESLAVTLNLSIAPDVDASAYIATRPLYDVYAALSADNAFDFDDADDVAYYDDNGAHYDDDDHTPHACKHLGEACAPTSCCGTCEFDYAAVGCHTCDDDARTYGPHVAEPAEYAFLLAFCAPDTADDRHIVPAMPRQFATTGDAWNYAEQLAYQTCRPVRACSVIFPWSVVIDANDVIRVGVDPSWNEGAR